MIVQGHFFKNYKQLLISKKYYLVIYVCKKYYSTKNYLLCNNFPLIYITHKSIITLLKTTIKKTLQ